MIEDASKRLAGALRKEQSLRLRQGKVTGLNADGTIDITLGGSDTTIDGVALLGAVSVGSGVWLLQQSGDLLALGGTPGSHGYRYAQTLYFTSNGTFKKADYPGLRAVRVKVQGGGGQGGGGQVTGANQSSFGDGGSGGGYCESFYLAADLSASESVVVGTGGSGGTTNGTDGGASSFKGLTASGGSGGFRRPAVGSPIAISQATGTRIGGFATGGHINIRGGPATSGVIVNPGTLLGQLGGNGGDSTLGAGGVGTNNGHGDDAGLGYGGGGGGGAAYGGNGSYFGGIGTPGIVIVEIYV